jgi:hypothetical protein
MPFWPNGYWPVPPPTAPAQTGLTACELAAMRDCAEGYLPDTCTVQTVSRASDGMGGFAETWANTYTSVPCMHSPGGGEAARVIAQQFGVSTVWVTSVAYDQAVATGNRIVFGNDVYEVLHVEDDHTYRALRRAYSRRLN